MCIQQLRIKVIIQRITFTTKGSVYSINTRSTTRKFLLGDCNTKVGGEDIFNPAIGNKSLHEINNDNGVRVVSFATSKNIILNGIMFPLRNIHKYTLTSGGKTHSQTNHILTDKRRHLGAGDVGAVSDTIISWLHNLERDQ
jgi:hypothetical protein